MGGNNQNDLLKASQYDLTLLVRRFTVIDTPFVSYVIKSYIII